MTTYSVYKQGKIQITADSLDDARSSGAFLLKNDPYWPSISVFKGTQLIGTMRYDYKVKLFLWNQNNHEPFDTIKLVDPISGKVKAFPKGMYLVKYIKNGGIKENIVYAKGMDDLRRKIINSIGEASAENSRYLGNVMYREGRYFWRVPVDLKKYVFKDTDIDVKTGKLKGASREHRPL